MAAHRRQGKSVPLWQAAGVAMETEGVLHRVRGDLHLTADAADIVDQGADIDRQAKFQVVPTSLTNWVAFPWSSKTTAADPGPGISLINCS